MSPINKICLGAGLALVLVVIAAFLYLVIEGAHLKTQLAQAQANDTACHIANDNFAAQIAHQNDAVEELNKAALLRERNARAVAQAAQKIAQAYSRAAASLAQRQATSDLCASSEKMFNDYIKGNP